MTKGSEVVTRRSDQTVKLNPENLITNKEQVKGLNESSPVSEWQKSPSSELLSIFSPLTDNQRIKKYQALIFPQLLIEEIPASCKSVETVVLSRKEISNVIQGKDDRLIVIVGPCSVHDPVAAMEYATKLQAQCTKYSQQLLVVMRTYFEKPRTTVGWKGLINDPDLNNSFEVNKGLRIGRRLLADITSLGVPVGCEYLDTLAPQYTADFVSWAAIGARTTECQLHRELASGLSMPVGFKNGTTGDIKIAIDACLSATHPHAFIGITKQGVPAIFHSTGNPDSHVILRGGNTETNYSSLHVADTVKGLVNVSCCPNVIIDFSHGNSQKDYRKQMVVCNDVCSQISNGSSNIVGVMIESNLYEGSQSLSSIVSTVTAAETAKTTNGHLNGGNPRFLSAGFSMIQDDVVLSHLRYGVSVTDACVSWESTLDMLESLAQAVKDRRLRSTVKKDSSV